MTDHRSPLVLRSNEDAPGDAGERLTEVDDVFSGHIWAVPQRT